MTDGGGPNAAQRKQVIAAIVGALGAEADFFRTAICTDSAVARFITGAMGWLYAISNMKMFTAGQEREAHHFLGLERDRHAPIIAAIPRMQEELRARQ